MHECYLQQNYLWKQSTIIENNNCLQAYNVSLMLLRNALLVDLITKNGIRVLKLDSIENARPWKEMDVLIFNSWHWWLHSGREQP